MPRPLRRVLQSGRFSCVPFGGYTGLIASIVWMAPLRSLQSMGTLFLNPIGPHVDRRPD